MSNRVYPIIEIAESNNSVFNWTHDDELTEYFIKRHEIIGLHVDKGAGRYILVDLSVFEHDIENGLWDDFPDVLKDRADKLKKDVQLARKYGVDESHILYKIV